jgi:transposase
MLMKMRVGYARRSYKGKIYETPLVITSYRDEQGTPRNKTLANLGKLPAFIVTLITEALKRGDAGVLEEYVHLKEITHLGSLMIGPAFVALSVLKQLGIVQTVKACVSVKHLIAIIAIIIERVISPKPLSVMALRRLYEKEAVSFLLHEQKTPSLKTWYGALASLEEKREEILKALYRRNHTPGKLYLYDITSSYFEGTTCPLADYGYNRDGKKGKMQVVIGIICDERGCPIWIDVFKGNTADQTTVKAQLINLKEKLGLEEFIFVGDRGMVTNARIEELQKDGWWESFRYITALTREEMMTAVETENHPIQLDLFDHHQLVEVEKEGTRYVLCHNPERKEQDRRTRQRLLDLTEEKLACINKNVGAGRIKKKDVITRRLFRWINRWGMERFFEVTYDEGSFSSRRKEEEITRYEQLDGCYVIRSNTSKLRETTEELRDHYKDLKHVEQAFRTMKTTDIQTRPIRHFNEPQVRGHIFACFLAYRVIWELRMRLAPVLERDPETKRCEAGSLADIWRELGTVSLAKFEARDRIYTKLSQIDDRVKKILMLCRVPTLDEVLSE